MLSKEQQDEASILSKQLLIAKNQEALAKAKRIAIEESIINLIGTKTEGAHTVESNDFKITTTAKMTRTVDQNSASRLREKYGSALFDILPVKYSVSVKALKSFLYSLEQGGEGARNAYPFADELMKAITTKPAKTSVSVKEMEMS